MRQHGVRFGAAVALGVILGQTLLPMKAGTAAGGVVGAILVTICASGAWPLIPFTLGVFRAQVTGARWRARVPDAAQWAHGVAKFGRRAGKNRRVRVGKHVVLVADTTGTLPGAGMSADVSLRLDPVRSRAERSAFRADVWARSRGVHARGRLLSPTGDADPTPGLAGRVARTVEWVRDRARTRLGAGRTVARDLVVALVLGDRRGLDADRLDSFRRAGLAHVLALSGMHVGVLALGFGGLVRALRTPRLATTALTITFLAGFALLTGGTSPILRSCGTGAMALAAVALYRKNSATHALGLVAGALLLMRPAWINDAGFRLTFVAAGTLALFAVRSRASSSGWRGRLRGLAEGLEVSAIVTLATAPEIVSSFGAISLLSPVTNLLAAFPATLALGWGALAAFLPTPDFVTDPFAASAAAAAQVLLTLAETTGRWPGGNVVLPAPTPALAASLVASACALAARRRPPLRLVLPVIAIVIASSWPRERVTFLDVGQGDATLIEAGGRAFLVDAGPGAWGNRKPPAVGAITCRRFRPLDALILTHGHLDHTGAAEALLRAGRVHTLVVRESRRNAALDRLVEAAGLAGAAVASPPREFAHGLQVFSPWPGDGAPPEVGENDRSLGARWPSAFGGVLLLGDGARASEAELVARADPARLRATVLLLPHHGSRDSGTPELLDIVAPHLAVISCGSGNPHGHPHPETLARLRDRSIPALRTDRDGTITLTTSPGGFRVRWSRGFPGPRALFPPFRLSPGRGIS